MQLMEDGQSRALRCDDGMFEKSALFWKYGFPSSVRSVGRCAESTVVAEDFLVIGYCYRLLVGWHLNRVEDGSYA